MENRTLIYSALHVPDKKNERAYIEEIYCSFPECHLLKTGKCIHREILNRCVYGVASRNSAPSTMKGLGSRKFIEDYKKRKANNEFPISLEGYYKDCLVVLKDYIYLPYPHMNHLDGKDLGIEFLSYSHVFSSGSRFMKLEDFTANTIVQLTKLRPMALMGGEIKDYQDKSLPLFLFHIKSMMPDLYNEALKLCPEIENKTLKSYNVDSLEFPISYLPEGEYENCPVYFGKGAKVKKWQEGVLHLHGTREELDNISWFMHCEEKEPIDMIFKPVVSKFKVKVLKSELLDGIIGKNPELVNNKK